MSREYSNYLYDRFMFRTRRYSTPYSFKKFWMEKIRALKRKNFVVKKYGELSECIRSDNENCSVCFDIFDEISNVHQTRCNHFFCVDCIEKWTNKNKYTCPLCRGDL